MPSIKFFHDSIAGRKYYNETIPAIKEDIKGIHSELRKFNKKFDKLVSLVGDLVVIARKTAEDDGVEIETDSANSKKAKRK